MLARHKWQVTTIGVLEDVFKERDRQVALHGHNTDLEDGTGPDTRWLLPFTFASAKEIQADLRAAYEYYEEETGKPTFVHVLLEEMAEAFEQDDLTRLEEELIQVAAVAVNWVEKIRGRSSSEG